MRRAAWWTASLVALSVPDLGHAAGRVTQESGRAVVRLTEAERARIGVVTAHRRLPLGGQQDPAEQAAGQAAGVRGRGQLGAHRQ